MFGVIQKNKGFLSELNTVEPVYKKVKVIDGSIKYVYHNNLARLLDKFFLTGNYHILSPEQRKFIFKFLEEADKITDIENGIYEESANPILGTGRLNYLKLASSGSSRSRSVSEEPFTLSVPYAQLDEFLGSFIRT